MKMTTYKEKYEAKKNAYDNLLKDYKALAQNYSEFKEIVIKKLEAIKGGDYCDYDVGYNTGIEHSIALVADMAIPLVFEAEKQPSFILRRLEYELLKYWNNKLYKYIARDRDGALYIYKEKPTKNEEVWGTLYGHARCQKGFEDFFRFIEWKDKEPMSIGKLLCECEVVDDD